MTSSYVQNYLQNTLPLHLCCFKYSGRNVAFPRNPRRSLHFLNLLQCFLSRPATSDLLSLNSRLEVLCKPSLASFLTCSGSALYIWSFRLFAMFLSLRRRFGLINIGQNSTYLQPNRRGRRRDFRCSLAAKAANASEYDRTRS